MITRTLFTIAFLLCISLDGFGQELWMLPNKFFLKPHDSVLVEFNISRDFTSNAWDLKYQKVAKAKLLEPGNEVSLELNEGKKAHMRTAWHDEGTKVIYLQTTPAVIEMEGEAFNSYLKTHSLDNAYAHRHTTNTLEKPGREIYERSAKLLVQVGDKKDDTYKKPTGFPLDIIPERNPYTVRLGDMVKFKILYEGKPLFGARVFIWNRNNDRTMKQPVYSQKDGMVEARMSEGGRWMVSVVKMIPSTDPSAEWHSYWSTLVFAVEE